MVKRPESHVTGDIGVNRVQNVCLRLGWACDVVQSDYGEDLIVQTTIGGEIDPFRTLFQVKTTLNSKRLRSRRFGLSILVPQSSVLKWLRNREPVVLILWDRSLGRGWWAMPSSQLREYDVILRDRQKERILLSTEDEFNEKTACTLGWHLRFAYYAERLLLAQRSDLEYWRCKSEGSVQKDYESDVPAIVFDICTRIGVITSHGISKRLRIFYSRAKASLARNHKDLPLKTIESMAIMLAFMGMVDNRCSGAGVPRPIIESCSDLLLGVVSGKKRKAKDPGATYAEKRRES